MRHMNRVLVGTMLQSATDPELMRRYQETVIAPRRRQSKQLVLHVNEFELIEV